MKMTTQQFDTIQREASRLLGLGHGTCGMKQLPLSRAEREALQAAYWLVVSVAEGDAGAPDLQRGSLQLAQANIQRALEALPKQEPEAKGLHSGPCHTEDCACWMDR